MEQLNNTPYTGREQATRSIMAYLEAKRTEASGKVPEASLAFALALAMPHDYPAWRMPQVYTCTQSALAQPWSVDEQDFSLPQPLSGTGTVGLPDGEMFLAVTRSPIYARIQYWPNPTNNLVIYGARFCYDPIIEQPLYGGPDANPVGFMPQMYLLATPGEQGAPTVDLNFVGFEATSGDRPHGEFMFAASHKGRRCFYAPSGTITDINELELNVTVVNPATGAPADITSGELRYSVHHYVLVGEEWVEYGTNPTEVIPTGSNSRTIQMKFQRTPTTDRVHVGAYHAYAISASSTVSTLSLKVACGFRHNTPTYSHYALPHLYEKRNVVGALRPVAAAAMLSPNSATFQRQGLVRGLQLPPGQMWTSAAAGGFNALNSAEGMWNGPWEKGIYGFLKPVGINEFEMRSPFLRLTDLGPTAPVVDVDYPLIAPGGTLVLYAKTDLQTLGSGDLLYAAGQSYTTTLRCVEFRTLDTWFKQDVPKLDQEELEIAMRMITHLPQFHENPLHIAAITGFLKAARFAGEMAFRHPPVSFRQSPSCTRPQSAFVPPSCIESAALLANPGPAPACQQLLRGPHQHYSRPASSARPQ
jgi:hypothetical protein